ncbi:TIGR03084 family metal-binding protein [Planosporangium sp. 12N6]|uniref:TIGR03084 family metal-binding protein n=1 Tax=Planosporangium spinosum TaxID=3402278 RepID=UPI003CF68078
MVDLGTLLRDLDEESADLDRIVADLPDADWHRPTPAPGWTIAHQIAHLAWTDAVATLAATDADAFAAVLAEAARDTTGLVDRTAAEGITAPPELLARWRHGRAALRAALAATDPEVKLPWFGPPMSPAMTATGRLMETWAHGQDVADALGLTRQPTARLRHVAYIGYRTLGHGFAAHGRPVPREPVRVALTAPDRQVWEFGPADAPDRLSGPALDFCLLVTQRRHRADLNLEATGRIADEWLDVAQAFAGPPGPGREPTMSGREPTASGREPTA